jgi:hypothetical protein
MEWLCAAKNDLRKEEKNAGKGQIPRRFNSLNG